MSNNTNTDFAERTTFLKQAGYLQENSSPRARLTRKGTDEWLPVARYLLEGHAGFQNRVAAAIAERYGYSQADQEPRYPLRERAMTQFFRPNCGADWMSASTWTDTPTSPKEEEQVISSNAEEPTVVDLEVDVVPLSDDDTADTSIVGRRLFDIPLAQSSQPSFDVSDGGDSMSVADDLINHCSASYDSDRTVIIDPESASVTALMASYVMGDEFLCDG